MSTGIMNGKTYSFAFNLPTRTVEWADYGVKLDVVALDDTILNTNVQMSISGWPPHDEILFNFNRVKMTVEGLIGKKQTSDDVEKCKSQAKGAWLDYCGMPIVVGSSVGQCKLIERLL